MAGWIRVGISGWQYDGWRGSFYPSELPKRRELAYVARLVNSIEINGTFYSLKRPETFEAWRDQTPAAFVFSVKGSRYITHTLRLNESADAMANFFASGVLKLGRTLGPILWQLPPRMSWKPDVFEAFCEMLPRTMRDAAKLAEHHDERLSGRTGYDTDAHQRIRHAFEVRDERMMNEEMVRILREHGHALVFADTAGQYPYAEDITAGFVYVRLHGAEELYASGYDDHTLDWWKRRVQRWVKGEQMAQADRISDSKPPQRKHRDVYVYFDNDAKVHAPYDAISLARKLNVSVDVSDVTIDDVGTFPPPPPRLQEERATAGARRA